MLLTSKQVAKLLKEEILNELPKGKVTKKVLTFKKPELIEYFMKYLGDSKIKHTRILKKYDERFSLHPSDLEDLLRITKTERTRWTADGKLKVSYYDSFHKWGQTFEVPIFSLYEATRIIEENKINKWRQEHKEKVSKSRRSGAKKASRTRKKHLSLSRDFYEKEWKELLNQWYAKDPIIGSSLQLAYWTMWVNRYAKEMQLKARKVVKKADEYEKKKDYFYELKEQALEVLIQSPISKLEFHEPVNPDKVTNLHFCELHYHKWVMDREYEYLPKWEFFRMNEKSIKECNSCCFDIEQDYYSLYYLSITSSDFEFSFHTPYPIAPFTFPDKEELSKVSHQEQEGLFKFGRSLFEDEKIIFREQNIEKYFKEALNNFNRITKGNTNLTLTNY